MNVVECNELVKTYKRTKAVDQLSLSIGENKIIGLVGRNGAGKTTLLKILSGYIKASSGKVRVFSKQPFNNLMVSANSILIDDQMRFPYALTLSEILEEAGSFYRGWDKEFALRLFRHFRFDPDQPHFSLSKGKKSTFNMIIGLASRCPLTMFDEPTTGMDAVVRKDFYRALLKDYLDYPRTIILSSHHLEEIEELLEEIVLIEAGKKVFHLPIDEVNELAVSLAGKYRNVQPWLENREVLHTKQLGEEDIYAVIKNTYSTADFREMKLAEVDVSSVSATEACIYITKQKEGSIEDVFKRG